MQRLGEFINEAKIDKFSQIGKKIFNALGKDSSDIVSAILKRNERWDENKFDWSRDPMFLVADAAYKNKIDTGETIRNLSWVRDKFFDTSLDNGDPVEGTLADYNIANDRGSVPKSILGIYFDRQFYPITSLDTYKTIRAIIENKED